MKTIKLILTAILLIAAYVANAQTIQVYKDGAVVKVYSSAEVDSVVYKPAAAQPRYYYYAGWDCPSSVEELERLAVEPYGGYWTSLENLDTNKNYYPNTVIGPYDYWFFVVPNGINVYDLYSGGLMTDNRLMFKKETNQPIDNYVIWKCTDDNKTDEFSNLKIY